MCINRSLGSSIIRLRTYKHPRIPLTLKKPSENINRKEQEKNNYGEFTVPQYNEFDCDQRPYGDNKYNQKKTNWRRMEQLIQELVKDGLIPEIDK